jgi:endonuclease/exonuclease/phosphatase family metal-dependent hydrolase
MKKVLFILLCAVVTACGGAKQEASTVSVMSFNIRLGAADDGDNSWDFRRDAVVKMIETIAPDVVGLQEAMEMQNEYLAEKLTAYTQLGVGRDDGVVAGEFMRVLYKTERYDALDSGNFWLSETPDEVSRGWDGACNRMATWVKLREKGTDREFFFFNTHLDHQGEVARREGVKLLIRKIDEIAGKATVFVTGDFNAPQSDPVMAPMFAAFTSARDEAPRTDHHGTFNGWGSAPNSFIIDFIFSRNATPITFRTVTENYGVPYVSDHYPIVANFEY